MGVSSGLELVTLPHGRQLRLDLMERFVSHTQSHCHTEIDNFSILSHQQGNRLRHNTRVLSSSVVKHLFYLGLSLSLFAFLTSSIGRVLFVLQ